MGGYGSGRPAWRPILERRTRLDVRFLQRQGWLRPGQAGSLTWSSDGEPIASVSYRAFDDTLELQYGVRHDGEEDWTPTLTSVPIEHHPWRFGGRRAFWRCPRCARRCEVVVYAGGRWACRKCLRLAYQSQRLAPADRLQLRADRLYARAGTDYGDGFVVRRKWMRWRTFNRLIDRANAASACADDLFLYRLRRFGFAADTLQDVMSAVFADPKALPVRDDS